MTAELTTYVGRVREADDARGLLRTCRVVTLVGPGGVGKTRLARRLADEVRDDYPDGLVFVELAELRSADLLATTVADRLGLYDQSARPALDLVVEHLLGRPKLLLVLDNCEHLVTPCGDFVAELIAACPDLTVLATSRQSLVIAGEQLYPVPPLSVPDDAVATPADLLSSEAAQLFVDRATAVYPSFAVTDANFRDLALLCRDLEGLPLAIELAAVRMRTLSLAQIRDRLTSALSLLTRGNRSAPSRQQTLRALIDWSYELLTPAERLVLARASVFSGGFDLAAAERVCCGGGVDQDEVFDIVHSLVDKSLLIRTDESDEPRFRMLETVREYGKDRLEQAGDTGRVARLHRDWFAEFIAAYAAEWLHGDQLAWQRRVIQEHANIRVALDFCVSEPGEVVAGLRMINRLDVYWTCVGAHNEARIWLAKALPIAPEDHPQRIFGLRVIAHYALLQGDLQAAAAALGPARELADRSGDEVLQAYVASVSGLQHLLTDHEEEQARDELISAVDVFRRRGVPLGETFPANELVLALAACGQAEEARALAGGLIAANKADGDLFWLSWNLWASAWGEMVDGDFRAAEVAALEGFRLQQVLKNRSPEPFTVLVLAVVAAHDGDLERAATLVGVSITMRKALGALRLRTGVLSTRFTTALDRVAEAMGLERFIEHVNVGRELARADAVAYVLQEAALDSPVVGVSESPLTKRETEIAALVADGKSNKEIAAELFISLRTVESHIDHINTKLGFKSRAQIAAWFVRSA